MAHRTVLVLAMVLVSGTALAATAWPLRIAADGRHLEDQNGTPFLITADTGWCMVNGLTDEEIDTYLAVRKAQGFNAIQFMLMAKHSGCAVGGGSVDRYGHSPFTSGDSDWSVPDEAYWTRVDAILNKVKAQDMLAIVTPAYLGFACYYGDQGWCEVMATQSAQRMSDFGSFLGSRYKAQGNIVWIAGGDANPMDYSGMDERVDALMSSLSLADTSHQLVTGHAGRRVSAFQGFGTHAWLTLNSAYDGDDCPDDSMAAQIATEYARTPVRPLHSIEQLYDEEGASASCLADQFLWIALGGGVGQSYGNGVVWNFTTGWNAPGTGINSPLAHVHTNAARLVRSRRFWLFAPDYVHAVVTSGYGSGTTTVAASRASTGETVMAYLPSSGTRITIDMTKVSGTHATAYWYDPVADSATLIGTYVTTGPLDFTSTADSLVLVLDDASKRFPPPASADADGDNDEIEVPRVSCPGCELAEARVRTGAAVQFPPDAVSGVVLRKVPGAVRIAWPSLGPPTGNATSYDLATGLLRDLGGSPGYAGAACLASAVLATFHDDLRLDPMPGEGNYYLVRARSPVGVGSFGPTVLDGAPPCP